MNVVSKQQWTKVQYGTTQLGGVTVQGTFMPGGLDLVTPTLRLQPGVLRDVLNFECAQNGGYSRIEGYERFDGRTPPHTATFQVLELSGSASVGDFTPDFDFDFLVSAIQSLPPVGSIITQDVTGATGTVIAVETTPTPFLVVTKVTGVFDTIHPIRTSPGGVYVGIPAPLSFGLSLKQAAIYQALAADIYRADILAVPGSGPVRGVVGMVFNGVDQVFAFRDNVGATAGGLWHATGGGWVAVPLGSLVSFTAGTGGAPPLDGAILTQGAVSATINRVMWQSGAWAGSAVGQMVVGPTTGGSFTAGAATAPGGVAVTLAGPQAAVTLLPGGRYEFTKGNFSGQSRTRRIYGCDGVNPAFEFDGTTYAPIKTGLNPDQPKHVTFHKNFLFVAQDSSIVHCAAGLPFMWSAVDGGGEIATGDQVNAMITLPGDQTSAAMAVLLRGNFSVLYGTDPTTFNYVAFSTGIGTVPYSAQNLFDTFILDDLGVITMKTTLNYGNFTPNTLTKNILPFIISQRGNLLASSVNREKSQYRLYFHDKSVLYVSMLNQQYLGATLARYSVAMNCVDTMNCVGEYENTFGGGLDGFVYLLDTGPGFDGAVIDAYITTAWDFQRSPRVLKRYRAVSLEFQGDEYTEVQFGYQLGYDSPQIAQLPPVNTVLDLTRTPYWDRFVWDTFTWDGSSLLPTDLDMTGTAENARFQIGSGTNYIASYTVNSIIYHYSMRRGLRV
jgi:hypothetical protein